MARLGTSCPFGPNVSKVSRPSWVTGRELPGLAGSTLLPAWVVPTLSSGICGELELDPGGPDGPAGLEVQPVASTAATVAARVTARRRTLMLATVMCKKTHIQEETGKVRLLFRMWLPIPGTRPGVLVLLMSVNSAGRNLQAKNRQRRHIRADSRLNVVGRASGIALTLPQGVITPRARHGRDPG